MRARMCVVAAILILASLWMPSVGFSQRLFPPNVCFSVSGERADVITYLVLSTTPSPPIRTGAELIRPYGVSALIYSGSLGTLYASGMGHQRAEGLVGNLTGVTGNGPDLTAIGLVAIFSGVAPNMSGWFQMKVGDEYFEGNLTQVPCRLVTPPELD